MRRLTAITLTAMASIGKFPISYLHIWYSSIAADLTA